MAKQKRCVIDAADAEKIAKQALYRVRNLGVHRTIQDVQDRIWSKMYFAYEYKPTLLSVAWAYIKKYTIWKVEHYIYVLRSRQKKTNL